MKKLFAPLLFATCASVSLLVASCQKDYNAGQGTGNQSSSNTTLGTNGNLDLLYAALATSPQNFTVHVGTAQTIKGAAGTILHFYPNSFKDKNGTLITSGTVTLQLTEMYKPGDMLANHASTLTADGNFLQSGGQVYIAATMGTEQVYANKYGIAFKKSDTATTAASMSLYYGTWSASTSSLSWTQATSASGSGVTATTMRVSPTGDTTSWGNSDTTYLLNNITGDTSIYTGVTTPFVGSWSYMDIFDTCTHFGYANNDRLPTSTEFTHIFLTAPDSTYTLSNTQLFLVLPALNSFTQNRIGSYNASTHTFEFGDDGDKVPVGQPYKLVIIANKGTSYYYDIKTGTTTAADMMLTTTPTVQTLTYIITQIKAL